MAFLKDKLTDNKGGKFYVDRQCIDCDVCRDTSPENFTRNDGKWLFVRQKTAGNTQKSWTFAKRL